MPWPCYVSPQKTKQIWGWCASLSIVCTCLAFMELHLFLGPMLDSKTRSTFFTEKAREWSATWTDSKLNIALQSNPWVSPYWQTRHRTCRTPLYWSQTQLRWSGIQALDPFSPPHYVKSPFPLAEKEKSPYTKQEATLWKKTSGTPSCRNCTIRPPLAQTKDNGERGHVPSMVCAT